MLRRSSKYHDVELNALITSAWLSLEKSFMKSHSRIKKNQLQEEHNLNPSEYNNLSV